MLSPYKNFAYDSLNRLLSDSGPGLVTRSFNYNAVGNITYKSDAGTAYNYPTPGATAVRPHAVSSITGTVNGITNPTFSYDANGNLLSGLGRTLTYTSFNLPATIAGTPATYTYTYNPEHERVKLVTTLATGTQTSIYLHPAGNGQLLYEKEIKPDLTLEHKHYVQAGSILVGVYVTKSSYASGDGPQMRYYHKDNLGSIAVITNPSGAVMERLAYEAFGKRRYPDRTADASNLLYGVTTDRGFTAHEHLDELGLIHMNRRIYDPTIGRFMSADPHVPNPYNLQSYNRYSYVLNSPLNGTDPSGYFNLGKALGLDGFLRSVTSNPVRAIATIAIAVVTYNTVNAWMLESAMQFGPPTYASLVGAQATAGAAGGFAAGFVGSGGDFQAGLKAGISGGIFGGISGYYGDDWTLGRVAANGVAGGINAELRGGKFIDGFRPNLMWPALSYLNYTMRDAMIAQSKLLDCSDGPCNSDGVSAGLRGDGFKLAGARQLAKIVNGVETVVRGMCESLAGGCQGADGQSANLLGIGYGPGGVLDRVAESFAGPHDWLRNATGAYSAMGNAIDFGGTRGMFQDVVMNYGLLVPAAPIALGGLVGENPLTVMVITAPNKRR